MTYTRVEPKAGDNVTEELAVACTVEPDLSRLAVKLQLTYSIPQQAKPSGQQEATTLVAYMTRDAAQAFLDELSAVTASLIPLLYAEDEARRAGQITGPRIDMRRRKEDSSP